MFDNGTSSFSIVVGSLWMILQYTWGMMAVLAGISIVLAFMRSAWFKGWLGERRVAHALAGGLDGQM